MTEEDKRHEPADPLVDDDLLEPSTPDEPVASTEETPRDPGASSEDQPDPDRERDEGAESSDATDTPHPETDAPQLEPEPWTRPRKESSRRPFVAIGWTMVVVVLVFAVLVFAGLLRVTSALNNANCLARAEANYAGGTGPHMTAQDAGLARLGLRLALRGCGN